MQVTLRGMMYTAMVINGVSLIAVGAYLFGFVTLFLSFLLFRFFLNLSNCHLSGMHVQVLISYKLSMHRKARYHCILKLASDRIGGCDACIVITCIYVVVCLRCIMLDEKQTFLDSGLLLLCMHGSGLRAQNWHACMAVLFCQCQAGRGGAPHTPKDQR